MSDNGKITWTNCRVKLGDLKPWAQNPRMSTKAQAKRILQSFERFGQAETISIGPNCEVYNGHQRLCALLTVYGPDYEIDARMSNHEFTEDERKEFTITLHAGAVGSWDFGVVSGWDTKPVISWGMNVDLLHEWNNDASNLREMLQAEGEPLDMDAAWQGMPEHISEEIRDTAFCCLVRFRTDDDRKEFEKFLGYKLSHKGDTYTTWFPKQDFDQLGRGTEFQSES